MMKPARLYGANATNKANSKGKKWKGLMCLVMFACLSISLFDRYITILNARRLKCLSRSNGGIVVNVEEEGEEDARRLINLDAMINRILDLQGLDICDTVFPDGALDTITFTSDSRVAEAEPDFIVAIADEQLAGLSTLQVADGTFLLFLPSDGDNTLDDAERNLISTFTPVTYEAEVAYAVASLEDKNSIAYVVVTSACSEWYKPGGVSVIEGETVMGSDLYEASAVLKTQVCEMTDLAATNRRLAKTRKLRKLEETGQLSAAEMNYTMHAIVHPMAVECPLQGTTGPTYNRVELLQSEGYNVEILGHPVSEADLAAKNPYIAENIADDVGIRDSMRLQAFTMTAHPIVVVMDYDSILQKPLDETIDFLLADESLKGFYVSNPPDEATGKAGVDTGFLIIKPSQREFERIVWMYTNTPYHADYGWNGFGYNDYHGDIGISGFLNWYFHNDNGYFELDRCVFAHTADEDCLETVPYSEAKHVKMYDHICGNPRECPYDHPDWSDAKRDACIKLHSQYYRFRYDFEEKYFQKTNTCVRVGLFKYESYLGYCTGPGPDGFLSMSGAVIEEPEWLTICSPDIVCSEGSFMKDDCTCTAPNDPCDACPSNTFCQTSPTPMCIRCNCGFCDVGGNECCESSAENQCQIGSGINLSCNKGNNYFPSFMGNGHICEDINETARTTVPNGCGCAPKQYAPCNFNENWGTKEQKCFVCSADDLATDGCGTCKECLQKCSNSNVGCMDTSSTREEFMACVGTITDYSCRTSCKSDCMKEEEIVPIDLDATTAINDTSVVQE